MIGFWVLIAAMTLAVLVCVLLPLYRQPRHLLDAERVNRAVVEAQHAELERDHAARLIDAERLSEVHDELAEDDLTPPPQPVFAVRRPSRGVVFAIILLLPALMLGLYWRLGGWGVLEAQQSDPTTAETVLPELVARLAARLQQRPDDRSGWTMLGRSYLVMQRYPEARDAFERAYALDGQDDVEVLVGSAEAAALAAGERMAGQPAARIAHALTLAPDHPKALWLSGMAAFQGGAYAQALTHWQHLKEIAQASGEDLKLLDDFLAEARRHAGLAASSEMPVRPPAAAITVRVTLAPALASRALPEDAVYIYAKAASGPPMPLAVVKRRVRDLPVTVGLSDRDAMMPQHRLSQFAEIQVGARIARQGTATRATGDFEGGRGPLSPRTDAPIEIVINKEVSTQDSGER